MGRDKETRRHGDKETRRCTARDGLSAVLALLVTGTDDGADWPLTMPVTMPAVFPLALDHTLLVSLSPCLLVSLSPCPRQTASQSQVIKKTRQPVGDRRLAHVVAGVRAAEDARRDVAVALPLD